MRLRKIEYLALEENGLDPLIVSDRLDAVFFWLERFDPSYPTRVIKRTTLEEDATMGVWIDGELKG